MPWRWRQQFPPYRLYVQKLHGAIIQSNTTLIALTLELMSGFRYLHCTSNLMTVGWNAWACVHVIRSSLLVSDLERATSVLTLRSCIDFTLFLFNLFFWKLLFCDVRPCSLVGTYTCFRETFCIHIQGRRWSYNVPSKPQWISTHTSLRHI
jgi:hypothetical protein